MKYAPATASDGNRIGEGELTEPMAKPSSLIAIWTLYVLTFRQHLHGRRWLVMAVLFSLPAALVVLIRATSSDLTAIVQEFLIVYLLIPQALLPIVALTYASGIIQDEQEEQTLTYLLIRPIPRWAIYFVKLLATLTTTVLLTSIFTAITFFVIYVGSESSPGMGEVTTRCLKTIAMHDLAVIAYCSLFGLISLFTSRTLVVGIVYTIIFEGLLANLPFGVRLITIIYYCRALAYQSLEFKLTRRGRTNDMAAEVWRFDPKAISQMISTQDCITVLVVASLVFAVIGSLLCARREFHVKTPEVN